VTEDERDALEDRLSHENFQLQRGLLIAEEGRVSLERQIKALCDEDTQRLLQEAMDRVRFGIFKANNRHTNVEELEKKLIES
jgi:hypothetical protein